MKHSRRSKPADARARVLASAHVRLVFSLVLAAVILWSYRDIYWRALDDHPQESTVSFHAFGFAAANGAGLWPNPLVARHIDVRESRIKPYNHWPNGFFLVFEGVLRIFGRTELAGRWVAILGTLCGFALVMMSLGSNGVLVYATLPLLLLSAAGRDSVGFIFIDVALNFSMGVLLWIVAHQSSGPRSNLLFRSALLAALVFNHLVAPFAAAMILLRWLESRATRELVIDSLVLAAGFFAVLAGLAAGAGSIAGGSDELLRIFRVRSSIGIRDWTAALYGEWRDLFNLGPIGAVLVTAGWLVVAKTRRWRIAILLPSYVLFTILLRQYVAGHHFARLPFVFFSLLTLAVAIEMVASRPLLQCAIAVLLAVPISIGKQQYEINLGMQVSRAALVRLVSDPAQAPLLEKCNAFQFHPDFREEGFDPFGLMGQFFFGPNVVERIRRGEPIRPCTVDLERSVIVAR